MELRRALLLFAIVLTLAAIVTSLSRPAKRSDDGASENPQALRTAPAADSRRTDPQANVVSFAATAQPRTERLDADSAAVVTVEVAQPGQVELAGLGLTAVGEPLTPARFELLESRPGRYKVRFIPALAAEPRTIGTLLVE